MSSQVLSNDDTRLRILDAVKKLSGKPFTVQDVVAQTGLPPYEAESRLNQVVKEYESDLDVDENGNLIYRFDPKMAARPDIVKKDRARRRKAALKQMFIAFFKAWTIAMVVIYLLVYLTLLLMAFVAAQNNNNNRSSSSSRRPGGGGIWFIHWGSTFGRGGTYSRRSRKLRKQQNKDIERRLREGQDLYRMDQLPTLEKPSLIDRTWFHLFGTDSIKRNPLEQEKELLTYIRAKKGFISNADIMALLGVNYEEADKIGTRLVATYDGELDFTDDAVSIYRFPNLMLSGAPEVQEQKATLSYLWGLKREEENLRQNPSIAIPAINILNIFLALGVNSLRPMLDEAYPGLGIQSDIATFSLLYFPLTFSLIFLALGLRRFFKDLSSKKARRRENMRIALSYWLFSQRRPLRMPAGKAVLDSYGFGDFSMNEWAENITAFVAELDADYEETPDGFVVSADKLWKEVACVENLRRTKAATSQVGKTVFSTRDIHGASAIGDLEAQASDKSKFESELEAFDELLND